MYLLLSAGKNDSLGAVARKAIHVATVLNVPVKFFWGPESLPMKFRVTSKSVIKEVLAEYQVEQAKRTEASGGH